MLCAAPDSRTGFDLLQAEGVSTRQLPVLGSLKPTSSLQGPARRLWLALTMPAAGEGLDRTLKTGHETCSAMHRPAKGCHYRVD